MNKDYKIHTNEAILDSKSFKNHNNFIESKGNLSQISSLKDSIEFDIVFKNGAYFHKPFLTINAIKTNVLANKLRVKNKNRNIESNVLLGFSINKKVAKACKRNLIKRRIKAIMRRLVREKRVYNLSLVFVCRKEILSLSFTELQNNITFGIKKLVNNLQNRKVISKH